MEVTNIDLQGALPLIARGKVRDLYEIDNKTLLFVATDRISAYDVIMENVRLPFNQAIYIHSLMLTEILHSGDPQQRCPPYALHASMVQNPHRSCPIATYAFLNPRPPASNPRIASPLAPESKHAGTQTQDPPHRGHRSRIHHRVGVEGVSGIRYCAWD